MTKKVLMSVLMCDRKKHFMLTPVASMLAQDHPDIIYYFNIETDNRDQWKPLFQMLEAHGKYEGIHYHVDIWKVNSSWWKKPAFDQDQQRLFPICIGRNMAIDAAMGLGCDYIQFVDSDMTFPDYTVSRLLTRDKKIIGGLVPARNGHKGVNYVFHPVGPLRQHQDGLVECDFGNIGFVLIHKDVFERVRFRKGPQAHKADRHLDWASDDPNFCFDAHYLWGFDRFFIDPTVVVDHVDDEVLTFKGGAQF